VNFEQMTDIAEPRVFAKTSCSWANSGMLCV